MKISKHEPAPGGYMVTIEIENAYTDGRSRFDRVFVKADDVVGKSREEQLLAVKAALGTSLAELRGADPSAPVTETKAVLEARLRQQVYDVANLITVHNAAVALGRPQSEITAWATLRNQLYFASLDTLEAWGSA